MISKSLIKLIDEAIFPASILIFAKLFGFFIISYFFNIPITINFKDLLGILPSLSFENVDNYTQAENFSNIVMYIVIALGSTFIIARAHFFHESHISPNLHAKLSNLSLEKLVAPSYHLYHQAAIWITFLWLATGFLLVSTIVMKITSPIVSIIAFLISANLSWVFTRDIEREIEMNKENV
jgi:hypothetical protein